MTSPPLLNLPWNNSYCSWKDSYRSSTTLTNNNWLPFLQPTPLYARRTLPCAMPPWPYLTRTPLPTVWTSHSADEAPYNPSPRTTSLYSAATRSGVGGLGLPWAKRTPSPRTSLDPALQALDDISASPFVHAILNQEAPPHFSLLKFHMYDGL